MSARSRLAGLLAAVVLALAGCVSVPTSGPVEEVEGQQPSCQSCVNVEVAPPVPGSTPREVVEGFLQANAYVQPGLSVARQFLTRAQAETWSPQGVWIYEASPLSKGDNVLLKGRQVGVLNPDRTFSATTETLRRSFTMVREDGEWRIDDPPPVLFVRQSLFSSLYRSYDLFFVGSGANPSLVPDPIYLPDLRAPGNIASALVRRLLEGPSTWLAPAVRTAIPQGTALTADSVSIVDGVAQVSFSEAVQQLSDDQRRLMAAQLVYTLQQVIGVQRVQLQVGSQPFRVPQSEVGSVPVGTDPALDPVPVLPAEQLYAVRDGALEQVDANGARPDPRPFPGRLGRAGAGVQSLGVSVADDALVVVTEGGTVLQRAPVTGRQPVTLLDGVTGLLRPQVSRSGEVFAVAERRGRQRMWVLGADGPVEVGGDVLARGRVTAFRVSPDGARLALLLDTPRGMRLGLARIVRSDTVAVDGWRPLHMATGPDPTAVTGLRDVAWLSATGLVVLAQAGQDAPFVPTTISIDASTVESDSVTLDWDGVALAVLLRSQTAIPVVLTSDGRVFRDEGNAWRLYVSGVTAVAYPG